MARSFLRRLGALVETPEQGAGEMEKDVMSRRSMIIRLENLARLGTLALVTGACGPIIIDVGSTSGGTGGETGDNSTTEDESASGVVEEGVDTTAGTGEGTSTTGNECPPVEECCLPGCTNPTDCEPCQDECVPCLPGCTNPGEDCQEG